MLWVPETAGVPAAWLLTLTGCLALAGLNRDGVGVAINNLRCRDGRVGLVWPALVRLALAAPDAARARDAVLAEPVGSGHHYLVADEERAFGVEATGTRKRVVFDGAGDTFLHTNHGLDPQVVAVEEASPLSTTRERYACLASGLAAAGPPRDTEDLWQRLGSHEGHPRSVCTHLASAADPHAMETCAAIVMEPGRRQLWAAAGCIHGREPEDFRLS
jgi:isopenicillin-N N-acyltransferase-like protein